MKKKPQIVIIIELKDRELLSKILIGTHLALQGWRVLLGSETAVSVIAEELSPSVILHNGTHPKTENFQKLGHLFVVLDEELTLAIPKSQIDGVLSRRYSHFPYHTPDLIFTVNSFFSDAIRKLPGSEKIRLVEVGSLKIDFWDSMLHEKSTASAVQEIRNRHGEFYLFVSSFGGGSESAFYRGKNRFSSGWREQVDFTSLQAFKQNLKMLRELDSMLDKDEKIILRPHLSERTTDWQKSLKGCTNIEIASGGDSTAWILAAKSVFTFRSSLVIQSALYGKQTVQLDYTSAAYALDSLAFQIPIRASSPSSLLRELRMDPHPLTRDHLLKLLETEGEGGSFPDLFALQRTLNEIALEPADNYNPSPKIRLQLAWRWLLSLLKHAAQKIGLLKGNLHKANDRTTFQNLHGALNRDEIQSAVENFGLQLKSGANFQTKNLGVNIVSFETVSGE